MRRLKPLRGRWNHACWDLIGETLFKTNIEKRKNKGDAEDGKFEYDFNISKEDYIFYHLIKYQQIRPKDWHKLLFLKKLEGKNIVSGIISKTILRIIALYFGKLYKGLWTKVILSLLTKKI